MFPNAGAHVYCLQSTDFQKCGLLHTHLLIHFETPCSGPAVIDNIVSAEIPINTDDAALVQKFMMHNHPASNRPVSKYCQKEHKDGTQSCRFHYPHPLQHTTTIDNEGHIHYKCCKSRDKMVVSHCVLFITKFHCHICYNFTSYLDSFSQSTPIPLIYDSFLS